MGYSPPPPPLTPEEFDQAVERCRREGLAPTLENIDPGLAAWRRRQRRHRERASSLMVILALVVAVLVIALKQLKGL